MSKPKTMGANDNRIFHPNKMRMAKIQTSPEYQAAVVRALTDDSMETLKAVTRMAVLEGDLDKVIKACVPRLPYEYARKEAESGNGQPVVVNVIRGRAGGNQPTE